jgi:hypothetical protein
MTEGKNPVDQHQELSTERENRRGFVKSAAKVAGVLAALGLTQEALVATAEAQDDERKKRAQSIAALMKHAVETQDMGAAIKVHGKNAKLTQQEHKALASLSKEDLGHLAKIQKMLAPIHRGVGGVADGAGVF